ncbi:MAG: hypothetical protein J6W40_04395 [Alphaproteobacteria bacterium]|nr:hypothetical protein [Alphaproteobacteria bacterium]
MKKILFAFLFVLSGVNAALAAEFLDIKANQCAITNNRIVCQYIPQRLQDYVIIGGTIVQPEGFEPFLPRVKIRFVPDDKNAKTLTTNAYTGSATFSLALKPEESGMLYFDIISQEALETYANPMPIPIKKNFDPESLKSLQVRVQYKNNSTRTGGGSTASTTRTGGGSSGTTTTGSTTGTTATGDLHTFSAYLIYDANNKHGSGISGATVIDVNTGNSTKTGRGGAFTLECLFTKQVNQNVGRQNIENLRSDLEASARNNGLKDPEAYATRIINENIQALFNTSTKPTAQCFLVFTAPNQASTYSNTITLEKAQNEYFVYKSYQRTSSPTRTSSGGNGSSSNDANTITVSGVVYSEGTKEHPEPILQEGVVLIPKGVKATNNNSAITGKNGTFTIEKFPRNHDLVAQFYTEQDALISYTDIEKNSSNIKIYVHEDNSGTVVVDNVEPAIADCMSDNMKKRLHATRGKWLGSTQNKDGKCIPTECQSDYTLEDAETLNARCLECNTNRVPFARSVKVENNRCVAKSCLDGFKEHSGNCVVDCSSSTAKNYLHATAAALKSNASTPSANETAQSLDYSKYCYPTACDTPKYAMSGSGENATCVSTSGTNCTDFIQHATAATINNGVCELQSCEDGYAVDKYALGISQKCDAAGHANDKCNGKCEYQIGKPCKGDIKTLTNDPYAKAGVITKFENGKITACKSTDCDSENYKVNEQTGKCERIAGDPCSPEEVAQIPHAKRGIRVVSKNGNVICRPVCWENYSERLSGNAYECYLKDLDCPKRIYNLPQYKDIASKMVVTNDDSYWDSEGNVRMCRIKECKDKTQTPNPENDFQTCIDKCTEAESKKLEQEHHAQKTAKDEKTGECIISECECGYDVSRDKKDCIKWNTAPSCTKRTEPSLPANAKTAHMACDNSKQK